MVQNKLLMIVNPTAGRSKPRGPLFDAAALFSQAGYLLSIRQTESPGDAIKIAAECGEDTDVVVAVGGDGTLNQTISGLMSLEQRPLLGYLPRGSTNDFAASLHISSDPAAAADQILHGQRRPWISGAGMNAISCMLPLSAPLPAAPTPLPRPPRMPWGILPISWRA